MSQSLLSCTKSLRPCRPIGDLWLQWGKHNQLADLNRVQYVMHMHAPIVWSYLYHHTGACFCMFKKYFQNSSMVSNDVVLISLLVGCPIQFSWVACLGFTDGTTMMTLVNVPPSAKRLKVVSRGMMKLRSPLDWIIFLGGHAHLVTSNLQLVYIMTLCAY